jgi:hypothetical protein
MGAQKHLKHGTTTKKKIMIRMNSYISISFKAILANALTPHDKKKKKVTTD